MKGKNILMGIGVVAVLLVLLSIGRITGTTVSGLWKDTGVACLVSGAHQGAGFHVHPALQIIVDGERESFTPNVGIGATCLAEIHTHDASGTVHAESPVFSRQLTLNDFFAVSGRTLEREGYEASLLVNGLPSTELGNLVFSDGQQIVLVYTSSQQQQEENASTSPEVSLPLQ